MPGERTQKYVINFASDPRSKDYMPGRVNKGLVLLNGSRFPDYVTQSSVPSANYSTARNDDLFRCYHVGSTVVYLKAIYSGTTTTIAKSVTGGTGTWSNITSTISATRVSFVPFAGTAYFFFNSTTPRKWTGTGMATTLTSNPATNCGIACSFDNRLWAFDSAGNGYWSEQGDAETWPAWNTDNFPNDRSKRQPIVAVPWGNEIMLFTSDSMTSIQNQGYDNYGQYTVYGRGARAYRAVISVADFGIMFADFDGVFVYNGGITRIAAPTDFSYFDANSAVWAATSMAYYRKKRQIWVSYPIGSANDTIRIFDLTAGSTWKDYYSSGSIVGVTALLSLDGDGDDCDLVGLSGGNVVTLDTGSGASDSSFDLSLNWSNLDFEEPCIFKQLKEIRIQCSGSGTLTVKYKPDHRSALSTDYQIEEQALPGSNVERMISVPCKNCTGTTFDIVITAPTTAGLKIWTIVFFYDSQPSMTRAD